MTQPSSNGYGNYRKRDIGPPAGLRDTVVVRSTEVGGQPFSDCRSPTGYAPGRVTGPVAVLAEVAEVWHLQSNQLALLLGYENHEAEAVHLLLNGQAPVRDRDQNDRIRHLLSIYGLLDSVFNDSQIAFAWLTEKKAALVGDSPLGRMLKGSMEDLLAVKFLVQSMAGR